MRGRWLGAAALMAVTVLGATAISPATARGRAEPDRVTPPAPLVRPEFVSASVRTSDGDIPVLLADEALPFTYDVDTALVARFGLAAITEAMAQWNGVRGSRWQARFGRRVNGRRAEAAPDGRSVLFFDTGCEPTHGGHVYRQRGRRVRVYGQEALYLSEVDIGVCESVVDVAGLRSVLAHEVGHGLGLDHLCNSGQACWRPGMGLGDHRCRAMYAHAANCHTPVRRRDHLGAVHVYPRARRVGGPTREETAARASYATFGNRRADAVVLARSDGGPHGPLAAAALAAALDGSLLLGRPEGRSCVSGSANRELARVGGVLTRVVLVGDWPSTCGTGLALRGYSVDRATGRSPAELSVAVADRMRRQRRAGTVFVASAADSAGRLSRVAAAAAAAGAIRAPLLLTEPDVLSSPLALWLSDNRDVRRAYVVGSPLSSRVLQELRELGLEVIPFDDGDPVDVALRIASHEPLFDQPTDVLFANAWSWPDAAVAAAVAGRRRAPLLVLSGADRRVLSWLDSARPVRGLVVGGTQAVPYEVQWELSRRLR